MPHSSFPVWVNMVNQFGEHYRGNPHLSPEMVKKCQEQTIDELDTVIHQDTVLFVVDYPLRHVFKFEKTQRGGWSKNGLLEELRRIYWQIYLSQEYYGVWGHHLEDLVLESMEIHIDDEGYCEVIPHIGS